jgi:hypothetical protein
MAIELRKAMRLRKDRTERLLEFLIGKTLDA